MEKKAHGFFALFSKKQNAPIIAEGEMDADNKFTKQETANVNIQTPHRDINEDFVKQQLGQCVIYTAKLQPYQKSEENTK